MIEIGHLTALVLVEVFLGMLIVSVLLIVFAMLRKRRIRQAARHLAERIQQDRQKRTDRLRALLHERYQQEGAVLEQSLHNIMQMEMVLYQNVINGFTKDDHLYLQQTDVDVENLALSYQALGSSVSTSAVSSADTGNDEEMERLRSENKRLSDELKVTMDTMGRMLNEYSTMFADGIGPAPGGAELAMQTADEMIDDPVESGAEAELDDALFESQSDIPVQSQAEEISEDDVQGDVDDALRDVDDTQRDVDDEVSEIIDEVMEMADEMIHEAEAQDVDLPPDEPDVDQTSLEDMAELAEEAAQTGESLVDDLSKIDIDVPEMDDETMDSSDFEEGSLEEEWAKLLEEESSKPQDEKKD
ncbi:MAG: hypothetical protein ABW101_04180 [Candidatus Thiodiazotropha sp.]